MLAMNAYAIDAGNFIQVVHGKKKYVFLSAKL